MARLAGVVAVLCVASIACTKKNPAVCCSTVEECQQVGFDEITGCSLDLVCVEGACVPPECTTSGECADPTPVCDQGLCVAAPPDAAPRIPYVVFVSDRDGNNEIYRMNPDGTGQVNLTSDPGSDVEPVWDPTGEQIAFKSDRSGELQLYVMDSDGQNLRNVSQGVVGDEFVGRQSWSPDGTMLVFTSGRSGTGEVYRASSDGSLVVPLTTISATQPTWRPNSSQVAFVSFDRLYVVDALNGAAPVPLPAPPSPAADLYARWSPDGERLAFVRRFNFTNMDFFVSNADGSAAVDVTNIPSALESNPSWSADGTHLAGTKQVAAGTEAFVIESSGANYVNVSNAASSEDAFSCWAPDGAFVVFTTQRDGNMELYRVAAAGGPLTNLSNSAGSDGGCAWRPM